MLLVSRACRSVPTMAVPVLCDVVVRLDAPFLRRFCTQNCPAIDIPAECALHIRILAPVSGLPPGRTPDRSGFQSLGPRLLSIAGDLGIECKLPLWRSTALPFNVGRTCTGLDY